MVKTSTLLAIGAIAAAAYLFINKSSTQTEKGYSSPEGENKSVKEALDKANEQIQKGKESIPAENFYKNEAIRAAATGRAVIIPASSKTGNKEIVVGPTGNTYFTDTTTGKGVYSAGKSSTLGSGSALISISNSKAQQQIKADIQKALTGPKVSAKGKYTPAKSKK